MNRSGLIQLALLGAAIMILDGYDLQVIAVVLPLMAADWGIAASSFGWVMTMPVFGLGSGALLVAPLGDRFGRRRRGDERGRTGAGELRHPPTGHVGRFLGCEADD